VLIQIPSSIPAGVGPAADELRSNRRKASSLWRGCQSVDWHSLPLHRQHHFASASVAMQLWPPCLPGRGIHAGRARVSGL